MSADLNWMIVRKTSSFIVKKKNIKKPFSRDPYNLKNVHSFRYTGSIRPKMVAIEPAADGKGFVLINKKTKFRNKPARNLVRSTIKHGARRALRSVHNFFVSKYRKDLRMAALRRASAIMKSQKPVTLRKKGGARKKPE